MKRLVTALLSLCLVAGLSLGAVALSSSPAHAGRIVTATCSFYVNGTFVASGTARGDSAAHALLARACATNAAAGTGYTAPGSISSSSLVNGARLYRLVNQGFVDGVQQIRSVDAKVPL